MSEQIEITETILILPPSNFQPTCIHALVLCISSLQKGWYSKPISKIIFLFHNIINFTMQKSSNILQNVNKRKPNERISNVLRFFFLASVLFFSQDVSLQFYFAFPQSNCAPINTIVEISNRCSIIMFLLGSHDEFSISQHIQSLNY